MDTSLSKVEVNRKPVNLKKDLLCGQLSGVITGFIFMFPEYIKVHVQTHMGKTNFSIIQALKSKELYIKLRKGTTTFPPLVGFVGAAQFACNNKIKESYGIVAGLIASGLSGSFFLTMGDHFMLRQETFKENWLKAGQFLWNKRGFFVGFMGTTLREIIFMTNMIYVGPWTGRLMHRLSGSSDDEQMGGYWNFLGRSTSGLLSTFVSHPFDVAARKQQMIFGQEGVKKPLFQTLFSLHREKLQNPRAKGLAFLASHPWLKGVMWRMWLGTLGGSTLGELFDYFSKQYDRINE